jgi:hypothetical protein
MEQYKVHRRADPVRVEAGGGSVAGRRCMPADRYRCSDVLCLEKAVREPDLVRVAGVALAARCERPAQAAAG